MKKIDVRCERELEGGLPNAFVKKQGATMSQILIEGCYENSSLEKIAFNLISFDGKGSVAGKDEVVPCLRFEL